MILIGNLGYPQQRLIGQSQVYVYDIATRCFRRIETAGEIPGWISAHEATFDGQNGIIVKGGKIIGGVGTSGGSAQQDGVVAQACVDALAK